LWHEKQSDLHALRTAIEANLPVTFTDCEGEERYIADGFVLIDDGMVLYSDKVPAVGYLRSYSLYEMMNVHSQGYEPPVC
jgi:hypothetical protein